MHIQESTKKASDEMKCFLRKIGSKKRDGELKLRQFLTAKTADRKSKELKFKIKPKHKELIEKKLRRKKRKLANTADDFSAAEGSARQGAPEDSGSTRNPARSAENANVSGRKGTHSASIRSAELMRSSSKNDKKSTERSSDRKHPEKKKCDVSHKKSSGKGTEQKTASPPTADSASDSNSQETTSKPSEHQTRKIKSKETSCTQSEHEEEERSVALYMVANNLQQRPPVEKRSLGRPPRSSRMDKEEVESSYYLW
ncbi:hypothetical protein ANCCAN_18672 [Ancylostoma caninum]|uniref:Uncharacterized protein n=1 Tax=Ancylostoma caninum TaxID=29170 RepID=A0A368FWU8_ANCCA|nr:hypothetical protein ANCCAN_18672 [Ancylostoma caninum]